MKIQKLAVLVGLVMAGGAQAATVTVHITSRFQFAPAQMEINLGDTVEFINDSAAVHTVTADPDVVKDPRNVILPAGAAPFNSGAIQPGAKFSHVFDVAGQYAYVCLPHERMGMGGGIEVLPIP